MHKVLFWGGFGVAVRLWQLGLEMRPLFNRQSLWAYPVYAALGGSFGYWLTGVSERQNAMLEERKYQLLAKRERRDQRLKAKADEKLAETGAVQTEEEKKETEKLREGDRGFLLGRN